MAPSPTRFERCIAYYRAHPDSSISEVAKAVGTSTRTAASARIKLVAEGVLPAGRNNTNVGSLPQVPTSAPPEPPKDKLLDDKALLALADVLDGDEDDEQTRRRLLREVKKLAFSPDTHPDTRLSATQVWLKLKDMAKAKTDGPGKPLTRAAAITRLVDLLQTVGPVIAIAAMYQAFNVKEPEDAGVIPAVPSEAPPTPPLPTPESASEAGVRPDEVPDGGPSGVGSVVPTDEHPNQG